MATYNFSISLFLYFSIPNSTIEQSKIISFIFDLMKILTTGRLGEEFYNSLKSNELDLEVRYMDAISQLDIDWADCLASFPIKENVKLSNLKWIHTFGAGVEPYIQRTDLHKDLILTRTTGKLGHRMGEFCLCHLLIFLQNTISVYNNQHNNLWSQIFPESLKDIKVITLGTGEMAKGISSVLKKNGVHITGVNTSGDTSEYFDNCVSLNQIHSISSSINCVINTLPLNENTNQLLDLDFFKKFNNSLFINVGREKSVIIEDLLQAIELSHISFAVLDVFEQEPLPKDSDLWNHPQLFISPHQAAITDQKDLIDCFTSVLEAIKSGTKNSLFVDIKKGY